MYIDHIKDFVVRFEKGLNKLNIKNVSLKTVFDLPLEEQPADHTVILAIPAGDDPEDQVLPGVQYKP